MFYPIPVQVYLSENQVTQGVQVASATGAVAAAAIEVVAAVVAAVLAVPDSYIPFSPLSICAKCSREHKYINRG